MPRKKPNIKKGTVLAGAAVGEEVRIAIRLQLKKFIADHSATECEFPSSLFAEERAYIHKLARENGLHSKSRGTKGVNRAVTVFKREGSSIVQADPSFTICPSSRNLVKKLLAECPLTSKERQDLLPPLERDRDRDRALNGEVKEINRAMGRLSSGVAQVPSSHCSAELLPFRRALPIWNMQEDIMRTINSNQVLVIAGETGSGKTTQVPQFILEHCQSMGKPCRIVCSEPRRISAVSVSERVSAERDEKLGQSVGYQIRLESRVSPKTVLTYCTNGVLLRSLMGGDAVLSTVTHIIVDEVHERDRFSDFLLIALRDALNKYRMLRLVLMSATVDTVIFTKYFNNCPVITVPGRQYEVKEYFLEDVLGVTGYMNNRMSQLKKELERKRQQRTELECWTKAGFGNDATAKPLLVKNRSIASSTHSMSSSQSVDVAAEKNNLDPSLMEHMDKCIEDAWLTGSEDAFSQLLYYIQTENAPIDYQHSQTSATPLMVAAGRGCMETTEQLLNLGANSNMRASNDWTALDWAANHNQTAAAELIEAYMKSYQACPDISPELLQTRAQDLSEEKRHLLEAYLLSFNDDDVDIDLCLALISHIHSQPDKGAILVFLPGYDVITTLRDRINDNERKFAQSGKFLLYTLHSNIQITDQKRVFHPAPPNTRKIILSTNIAETSITIDDVVYVIDSGKVKEKSFDAISNVSSLKDEWISQSCAKQRKGRAGRTRPGVCYYLFSSIRYQSMQQYQTPEILRMPLQELCLHTKLLAPANTTIADFLSRAMEPPGFMVIRNAVQLLKTIDALDPWEDLTELGHHLLDLPIEPRLGKMLLHAVVLKCLDPVLTIVCTLAYKDPFVLPAQPNMRRSARLTRRKFSSGTYSDHMALLRAFQAWQQARSNGRESSFCERNFISSATMEQVMGLRAQLLGQLRASGFVRAKGGGDIRDLNTNAENWAVVKAALTAGFYPNIVRVDREGMQLRTKQESVVSFHPSSTLRNPDVRNEKIVEELPTDWLVFEEMSRVGRFCHVRMCTVISPGTVALFGGPMRLSLDALSTNEGPDGDSNGHSLSDSEWEDRSDGHNAMLKLDDWINFSVDGEAAHLALQLRQKWNSTFLRRMRSPSKAWNTADDAVVQAVVQVLTSEEKSLGLQQPDGVGQRPRPLNIDFYPSGGQGSVVTNRRQDLSDSSDSLSSFENLNISQRHFQNSNFGGRRLGSDSGWSSTDDPSEALRDIASPEVDNGVRHYIIKAGSPKAIEASLVRGVWAFTSSTERKILGVFKEGKRVMLIFSMQGSGSFQGIARLIGDRPDPSAMAERCPDLCGPNLGAPLPIEWIKWAEVPFLATRHLVNPYNENRRVQTSRDGQELEYSVAIQLCSLWDKLTQLNPMPVPYHPMQQHMRNKGPFLPHPQPHHFYQRQSGGRPIRGGFQNGAGFSPLGYGHYNGVYGGYGRNHHPRK